MGVRLAMKPPTETQLLRYLYERRAELTFDISHAKAQIIAREAELERTERAIAELENMRQHTKGSD